MMLINGWTTLQYALAKNYTDALGVKPEKNLNGLMLIQRTWREHRNDTPSMGFIIGDMRMLDMPWVMEAITASADQLYGSLL